MKNNILARLKKQRQCHVGRLLQLHDFEAKRERVRGDAEAETI